MLSGDASCLFNLAQCPLLSGTRICPRGREGHHMLSWSEPPVSIRGNEVSEGRSGREEGTGDRTRAGAQEDGCQDGSVRQMRSQTSGQRQFALFTETAECNGLGRELQVLSRWGLPSDKPRRLKAPCVRNALNASHPPTPCLSPARVAVLGARTAVGGRAKSRRCHCPAS